MTEETRGSEYSQGIELSERCLDGVQAKPSRRRDL
jgi:hypothetical protein